MGGIRLGLEQALAEKNIKSECVLTSEIKPYAIQVYKENFNDSNIKGDISQIEGKDIPDFDMLLAGFPCFVAGTLIYTDKGYIPIEDINIGMKVLTHTNTFKEVLEIMSKESEELYQIKIGKKFEILATANHPFYVREKTVRDKIWVKSKDLKNDMFIGIPSILIKENGIKILQGIGEFLYSDNIYWIKVDNIKIRKTKCKVYNLAVDTDNSYTANNFIVHNCQPFSSAGRRAGFEDTRGTLFFEIARILKEKQPKYFLLENVENLVVHDLSKEDKKNGKVIGKTLEVILNILNELGYKVTWKVLQSSDFGVPQNRRRIYIVGCKDKYIDLDNFNKKYKTFNDVKEDNISCLDDEYNEKIMNFLKKENLDISFLYNKSIRDKRSGPLNIHSWNLELRGEVTENQKKFLEDFVVERRNKNYAIKKGLQYKEGMGLSLEDIQNFYKGTDLNKDLETIVNLGYLRIKKLDKTNNIMYDINGGRLSFQFTKFIDPNSATPTLVATDISKLGVVEENGIRKLTIKECLRLNGFPDDFKLSLPYNKSIDLLGNTVTVPIIKMICERILK